MFCSRCGSDVRDANFCPICGAVVYGDQVPPPPQPTYDTHHYAPPYGPETYKSDRDRWIACALCFFLGVVGAHRFYAGKIGTGVLYLFTGGVFGIGALVDFIMILCGTFRDIYGRPLL